MWKKVRGKPFWYVREGEKEESCMKLLYLTKDLKKPQRESHHIIVWVPITNSEIKSLDFFSFFFFSFGCCERESIETEQQKTRTSDQENGERNREIWTEKKIKTIIFLSFSLLSMVCVPFWKLQKGIKMLTSKQEKEVLPLFIDYVYVWNYG